PRRRARSSRAGPRPRMRGSPGAEEGVPSDLHKAALSIPATVLLAIPCRKAHLRGVQRRGTAMQDSQFIHEWTNVHQTFTRSLGGMLDRVHGIVKARPDRLHAIVTAYDGPIGRVGSRQRS